jgi:hypothetical protein
MLLCQIEPVRTTVEVPDPVFREIKALAARNGSSLKELVLRAIEREIAASRRRSAKRASVKLPLVPSKRPGALRSMTNAEIEDLLG